MPPEVCDVAIPEAPPSRNAEVDEQLRLIRDSLRKEGDNQPLVSVAMSSGFNCILFCVRSCRRASRWALPRLLNPAVPSCNDPSACIRCCSEF